MWQFLYSLLTTTESKHREIIEWTSNIHEREFRMLEPESIAIWWGHHKNKPNMSYDKFSRSLRYYDHKGILKKIPGERYVYRFLINPEHMYSCISASDCHPKLKPMPPAAKIVMLKNQHISNIDFKTNRIPIITNDPEPLEKKFNTNKKTAKIEESTRVNRVLSARSDCKSSNNLLPINSMMQNSSSMGKLVELGHETGSLSMKRSRSLEYAITNCCKRNPRKIALSNNSTSCPLKLRSIYESLFPNDLRDYSHAQCITSQDAFATSQISISEPLYVRAVGHSKDMSQVNMPQKHYYSQPKSNAEFTNIPISLQNH